MNPIRKMTTRVPAVGLVMAACLAAVAGRAPAALLLYEPFNYSTGTASGSGVLLSGQNGGTGFATGSSWSTSNSGTANSVTNYLQGSLSGVNLSNGSGNTFNGTVANLPTSGGYFGPVTSPPGGTSTTTDHIFVWRAIHPDVTATFTAGSTTWMSYVSARAFNLNATGPKIAIGAGRLTGERGDKALGQAIGLGGGVGSGSNANTLKVFGQFWDNLGGSTTFDNYDPTGKQTSTGTGVTPVTVPTQAFDWSREASGQPIANIEIAKITWSDSGPDVLRIARFLPTDGTLTEAMFNSAALSSETWPIQPSLNQSTFNTISIAGARYFADEFRIATTFEEVVGATPAPEPASLAAVAVACVAAGGVCLRRSARRVARASDGSGRQA